MKCVCRTQMEKGAGAHQKPGKVYREVECPALLREEHVIVWSIDTYAGSKNGTQGCSLRATLQSSQFGEKCLSVKGDPSGGLVFIVVQDKSNLREFNGREVLYEVIV